MDQESNKTTQAPIITSEPKRPSSWPLFLLVSACIITAFFFCLDLGEFYMDRSKPFDDTMFSICFFVALFWVVRKILKNDRSARSRGRTLAVIAILLLVPIAGGFMLGKELAFPTEARAVVQSIGTHAREIKRIKDQIKRTRATLTDPGELPSIQPLVASLGEHIDQIMQLDSKIERRHLPLFDLSGHPINRDAAGNPISRLPVPLLVAEMLEVANDALVFDRQQVQNVNEQIAIVRAAKHLSPEKKANLYQQRLLPLMKQEDEIEHQRQVSSSSLERRIKELQEKTR